MQFAEFGLLFLDLAVQFVDVLFALAQLLLAHLQQAFQLACFPFCFPAFVFPCLSIFFEPLSQ
jgi:hypothetical protein